MGMAMVFVDSIGVHPITNLITGIIKAVSTARRQSRVCREFVQWLETIHGLLKPLLEIPEHKMHPATRNALKKLEEWLEQAHLLVNKYKDCSYLYGLFMGSDIIRRFRDKRDEIRDWFTFITFITHVVNETTRPINTRYHDMGDEDQKKGINKEQMDQKKGKNKEEGGRDKKDTEKRNNKETTGKEENEKVKEKERRKRKEMEKEMGKRKEIEKVNENWRGEEDRRKGKDEKKKKNVPPTLLELCDDCFIFNYPGIEEVAMNKLFFRMPVVVHFDAKMLHERDYVAKNTKSEVHLISKRGRERDDYQVLQETEKNNKGIVGERKPNGGSNNKNGARVVLKVGGTGLQCGCLGCTDKIQNGLSKIRDLTGVEHVDIDKDNDQVIVTGTTMNTKTLQKTLSKSLDPRPVEVYWSRMINGKD